MATNKGDSLPFTKAQIAVIALGCLVFILIFFSNKTNLSGENEALAGGEKAEMTSTAVQITDMKEYLSPLDSMAVVDSLLSEIEATSDPDKSYQSKKSLVAVLREANKLDWAGYYASEIADEQPEVKNHLVAGALLRTASGQLDLTSSEAKKAYVLKAINHLEKAEVIDPENTDVLIELGLSYIESGQPENSMKGIKKLLKTVEIDPENEEAIYRLGLFSTETGQFEKAAERFEKLLEINPENLEVKYYLANLYAENLQKTDQAVELLNELSRQTVDPKLAAVALDMLNKLKN